MQQGVYCANFGVLGDPAVLVDLAIRAERAGWDGFFLYDHILIDPTRAIRSADPWIVLGAIASQTELVLGPLVTPLPRRQPWEVAHQLVTLAAMSPGKVVLGAGLGETMDHDAFGPETDPRTRGRQLDEALDVLGGFLAGNRVTHEGTWRITGAQFRPPPAPIPVWIAGRYPAGPPLRRAARFDGFFPIAARWDLDSPLSTADLAGCVARVKNRTVMKEFDFIHCGVSTPDRDGEALVSSYSAAGATWWLEIIEPRRAPLSALGERIDAGPAGRPPRSSPTSPSTVTARP